MAISAKSFFLGQNVTKSRRGVVPTPPGIKGSPRQSDHDQAKGHAYHRGTIEH
jgi:hypothetical protein